MATNYSWQVDERRSNIPTDVRTDARPIAPSSENRHTHQLRFFLQLSVERIFLSIRRAFLIGLNRHRGNEEGRVGFASILLVHWNDHKSEKEIR